VKEKTREKKTQGGNKNSKSPQEEETRRERRSPRS
jgi:hypothetical protein